MDYAGLGSSQPLSSDTLRVAWRLTRRGLILGSAVVVALLISGGIFTFTPLIGLHIAHTHGVSMEPANKEGDVVLIKDVSQDDLHVGDVVVFSALGQKIMHRIIEQRTGPDGESIIVTQGDNVARPDFPIPASQVSGKLVGEIPLLGTLSRMIDAQGGFYVYRSIVLTLAVSAVAIWGLSISVQRRRAQLADESPNITETLGEPEA